MGILDKQAAFVCNALITVLAIGLIQLIYSIRLDTLCTIVRYWVNTISIANILYWPSIETLNQC